MLNLKGDIAGGLTAGIVALPLALAFGLASGLGASAGLYGAIFLSFFAAIFGGTKTQISGPTGPMTVVVATVVLVLEKDMSLVVGVFVLAGLFQILFGFLRVGKFVKFIPYPVISGFMNGVGLIIIILQIAPLFGNDGYASTIGAILGIVEVLKNINPQSAILGILSLAIIYLTPKKISTFIPSPLLALVLLTFFSTFFGLDVKTIGAIPNSLPHFIMPDLFDFSKISILVSYGAMLALLGSIDSLLTSLVADSLTKTKHNSNRELIGQGIGNIITGFFGGVVGAGATMRTVTNIKTGATTRISGVVSSLFLVLVLLILGEYVSKVPIAVLSGILIKVGFDIFDYRLLKNLRNAPAHDLLVMLLVFSLTVFVDLIFAVGIGIVASSLLLVYRISKEANVQLENEDEELDITKNGVRVISINGAFFFGSTSQIIERASNLIDLNILVIDVSNVPFIDLSAAYALEEMIQTQLQKEIVVYLVISQKQSHDKTVQPIIKLLQSDKIYHERKEALMKAVRENKAIQES